MDGMGTRSGFSKFDGEIQGFTLGPAVGFCALTENDVGFHPPKLAGC